MSVNKELYDRATDHNVMMRGVEAAVQKDTAMVVGKHKGKLRNILTLGGDNIMTTKIMPEIKRFTRELTSSLGSNVKDISLSETDFNTNNLNKSVKKFARVNKPSTKSVTKSAITSPIGAGNNAINTKKPFKGHVTAIGAGEARRIHNRMVSAQSKGMTGRDLRRRVLSSTKLTSSQSRALSRTAVTSTQTASQKKVLEANKGLLKGFRFSAILDSKTSTICSHQDGKIYPVEDKSFLPPLHWNCRSSLSPLVKSKSDLLKSDSSQLSRFALLNLNRKESLRLSGTSPDVESYGTWLMRQPREVKIRHLGDTNKVDLFDRGRVKLTNFTDAKGAPASVTALRRLDNKATVVTPTIPQRAISQSITTDKTLVNATKPRELVTNKKLQKDLRDFFEKEVAVNASPLSLVDFRGTTLPGKKSTRRRVANPFDNKKSGIDPLTGEYKSIYLYEPDHIVLQERLDFLDQSKLLNITEKKFIKDFTESLQDSISVNQQSAVVENLRINFERYARDKKPWNNFVAVTRAEIPNSVVNTSRILDRRSRTRAQVFSFGNKNESSINVLGTQTTFDDISKRTLDNQRYISTWLDKEGASLARSSYFRAKAPLSFYLPKPGNFLPKLPAVRENILKSIRDTPGGRRLADKLEGKPNDSILGEFLAGSRNLKRKVLDAELFYALHKRRVNNLTPTLRQKRQKDIARALKTVAVGESTDYDTLAITIGKNLFESNKTDLNVILPEPSLKNYHKMGSRLLTGLQRQGKIKIGYRGVVRRGVNDLDSGRPAIGSFNDTVSREITVVDPQLLKLRRASHELIYSRRIGIVRDRDRLYVKPGQTKYVDARGDATDLSVITRRASGNYERNLVDRDFSKALNHAMDTKYKVDPEFSSFFDDLVYFRDQRGNVAKYDELNGFRKIILQRGEAGAGLIQTVKWHRDRGKAFSNPVQIDGRGRVYSGGYLHPAGGELVRPFLNSAKARAINASTVTELRRQIGAYIGDARDVLTNRGRLKSFYDNEAEILKVGRLIGSKTQREARLKSFMESPLIASLEPEEIARFSRFALEYARVYDSVGGDFTKTRLLGKYKTSLLVENDASASAAQVISLSAKDKSLAFNTNVVPTKRKQRLYDTIAERTLSDPRFHKLGPGVDKLDFKDLIKASKAQNLFSLYGAGKRTQAIYVEAELAEVLGKKGFIVIRASELTEFRKSVDTKIKFATNAGALNTAAKLKAFKREVVNSIEKDSPIGSKLAVTARDIHPDSALFVEKLTSNRKNLVGPRQFKGIASIMSEHLAEVAPITEKFINFWKDAGQTFIIDSQKVDIPWYTFDKKVLYQRYRTTQQERIEFKDPVTKRKVANVYEDKITDGDLVGKSSIINARSGLGVNGNHMNDAAIVRQFHLWGRRNNIPTATIHDAFFTNITYTPEVKKGLRVTYANALESNTIRETLRVMRKDGLSRKSYRRLLDRARREGLLDIKGSNRLTKKDITREIGSDEDWYGIGP